MAARRGPLTAIAVQAGGVAYLTYNRVMFCFATPFNRLFLLYVAMLSRRHPGRLSAGHPVRRR